MATSNADLPTAGTRLTPGPAAQIGYVWWACAVLHWQASLVGSAAAVMHDHAAGLTVTQAECCCDSADAAMGTRTAGLGSLTGIPCRSTPPGHGPTFARGV